jgi:small subunit ribosomal protein S6
MIFDSGQGEEKIGQFVTKIEDKIKGSGGEVEKVEKWGTRRLASVIKKAKSLTQGYYVLVRFKGPSPAPAELRAYLKVSESVVRYFLSRAVAPEAVVSAIEAVSVGEIKGEPLGKSE